MSLLIGAWRLLVILVLSGFVFLPFAALGATLLSYSRKLPLYFAGGLAASLLTWFVMTRFKDSLPQLLYAELFGASLFWGVIGGHVVRRNSPPEGEVTESARTTKENDKRDGQLQSVAHKTVMGVVILSVYYISMIVLGMAALGGVLRPRGGATSDLTGAGASVAFIMMAGLICILVSPLPFYFVWRRLKRSRDLQRRGESRK